MLIEEETKSWRAKSHPVDVAHVREVAHAGSDASHHADELDDCKLGVVVL